MKSLNILPLLSVLILLLAFIVIKIISCLDRVCYTSEVLSENVEPLSNPYIGFYHIIGYTLSEDNHPPNNDTNVTCAYTRSLALLEINLKNYRATDISEKGLAQLDEILTEWEGTPNGTKLILRFLYDWDGIALATEPDSLNLVLKHMEQIAPTVNRHRDCIYIMQGVFIGNWGEMHHSKFQDEGSVKQLINKLNDVIDPSIYLSVRTPKQWRTVTGIYSLPEQSPDWSTKKTLFSRLGLFNDGILGSDTDLGTYAENEREKELAFQNNLCRYVPNGGEVVFNQKLSSLETAVSALKEMQISYLNADYDSRVLEKWKNAVWQGNDAFNGCDGYTYVKAHLGYRYLIDSFRMKKTGLLNTDYTLCLTLINSGFSNTLKPFEASIVLENTNTKECSYIPFNADFMSLYGGDKKTFRVKLPIKTIKKGEYLIYFSVKDKVSGQTIAFAHQNQPQKYGILIGRLKK